LKAASTSRWGTYGDGILDLIVGAGKDHAPEVVVYAGASIRGKGAFGTELARFQPFDSQACGGVSVAAAQIDGTNADNLIVGSGPGVTSEVRSIKFPWRYRLAPGRRCSRRSNRMVSRIGPA
jgi:hypothetical protein